VVEERLLLAESFHHAEQSLQRRFFHGPEAVVEHSTETSPPVDLRALESLEREIAEHISNHRIESVASAVRDYAALASTLSYSDCLDRLVSLCNSMSGRFHKHVAEANDDHTQGKVEKLRGLPSLADATEHLIGYFVVIAELLEHERSARFRDVVHRLQSIAKSHLPDSDLCVTKAADELSYSAEYAGRIFRSETGKSFQSYVNDLRMDEAGKLLRDTELTVAEIAGRVGIANYNYFFTLFRKRFGVTPGRFRDDSHSVVG
jgi:AraC-like DNA-binding protein